MHIAHSTCENNRPKNSVSSLVSLYFWIAFFYTISIDACKQTNGGSFVSFRSLNYFQVFTLLVVTNFSKHQIPIIQFMHEQILLSLHSLILFTRYNLYVKGHFVWVLAYVYSLWYRSNVTFIQYTTLSTQCVYLVKLINIHICEAKTNRCF